MPEPRVPMPEFTVMSGAAISKTDLRLLEQEIRTSYYRRIAEALAEHVSDETLMAVVNRVA